MRGYVAKSVVPAAIPTITSIIRPGVAGFASTAAGFPRHARPALFTTVPGNEGLSIGAVWVDEAIEMGYGVAPVANGHQMCQVTPYRGKEKLCTKR